MFLTQPGSSSIVVLLWFLMAGILIFSGMYLLFSLRGLENPRYLAASISIIGVLMLGLNTLGQLTIGDGVLLVLVALVSAYVVTSKKRS